MTKVSKAGMLSLKVTELKLDPKTREALLTRYKNSLPKVEVRPEDRLRYKPEKPPTVRQLMDSFGAYNPDYILTSCEVLFVGCLMRVGFTSIDWMYIPRKTITEELLKKYTKDQLLGMPAFVLPEVAKKLVSAVAEAQDAACALPVAELTIQDLLTFDKRIQPDMLQTLESNLMQRFKAGIKNTRRLLKSIGFTEMDGRLMTFGTPELAVIDLAQEYNLELAVARRFLEIAYAKGWTKRPPQ